MQRLILCFYRAIEETKQCVESMILGCDPDTQQSVLAMFDEVKCLAEDICSKVGEEEVDDQILNPPECVDPAVAGMMPGAECQPLEAYSCLWKYKLKVKHPLAMMYPKKKCL